MATPTFVVEDGTGLATANAYATVAFVDQYLCDFEDDPASWTALTTAQKEAAIRKGTRYVDTKYSRRFPGEPTVDTQCLQWPRLLACRTDDRSISSDEVPKEVQQAVALMAWRSVTESTDLVPDVALSSENIRRTVDKVDVLVKEREYFGGGTGSTEKSFTIVDRILRPVLLPTGTLHRA